MLRKIQNTELENMMRRFRRSLCLEDVAYLDPMTVMTKLKAAFPGLNYERVSEHSMQNAEAQWDSDRRLFRIREDTFQGMQQPDARGRCRFAFFHEVQHFALQHDGIRNRSILPSIAEIANRRVARMEREANRATSIFMAPRYLVLANESAQSISWRFGMSRRAAEIRREELDEIERSESGQMRKLPQSAIDYLREKQQEGYHIQSNLDED